MPGHRGTKGVTVAPGSLDFENTVAVTRVVSVDPTTREMRLSSERGSSS